MHVLRLEDGAQDGLLLPAAGDAGPCRAVWQRGVTHHHYHYYLSVDFVDWQAAAV